MLPTPGVPGDRRPVRPQDQGLDGHDERDYGPRYFVRLSRSGDPNAAISYGLGNGSVTADQRQIVDQGFLELVRLGVLPASDPDVTASLGVIDTVIRRTI